MADTRNIKLHSPRFLFVPSMTVTTGSAQDTMIKNALQAQMQTYAASISDSFPSYDVESIDVKGNGKVNAYQCTFERYIGGRGIPAANDKWDDAAAAAFTAAVEAAVPEVNKGVDANETHNRLTLDLSQPAGTDLMTSCNVRKLRTGCKDKDPDLKIASPGGGVAEFTVGSLDPCESVGFFMKSNARAVNRDNLKTDQAAAALLTFNFDKSGNTGLKQLTEGLRVDFGIHGVFNFSVSYDNSNSEFVYAVTNDIDGDSTFNEQEVQYVDTISATVTDNDLCMKLPMQMERKVEEEDKNNLWTSIGSDQYARLGKSDLAHNLQGNAPGDNRGGIAPQPWTISVDPERKIKFYMRVTNTSGGTIDASDLKIIIKDWRFALLSSHDISDGSNRSEGQTAVNVVA